MKINIKKKIPEWRFVNFGNFTVDKTAIWCPKAIQNLMIQC